MFLQTHLTFGKEFTEAVEMKQVAQQEAERARFVVEKVIPFNHYAIVWHDQKGSILHNVYEWLM